MNECIYCVIEEISVCLITMKYLSMSFINELNYGNYNVRNIMVIIIIMLPEIIFNPNPFDRKNPNSLLNNICFDIGFVE